MADSDQAGTKPITAPDDMHWGINYLREDIQDIRAEARESRSELKAEIGSVREAMEARHATLMARISSPQITNPAGAAVQRAEPASPQSTAGAGDLAIRDGVCRLDATTEALLHRIDICFYRTVLALWIQTLILAGLIKL